MLWLQLNLEFWIHFFFQCIEIYDQSRYWFNVLYFDTVAHSQLISYQVILEHFYYTAYKGPPPPSHPRYNLTHFINPPKPKTKLYRSKAYNQDGNIHDISTTG